MTTAPPAIGDSAVTVAALRAAADLVEQSSLTWLSITCDGFHISVQVPEASGTASERAEMVATLAGCMGTASLRDDSHTTTVSWVIANGVLTGIPVRVFTAIAVRLACRKDGSAAYWVTDAEEQITHLPEGSRLPSGWRWITELDPFPAS